MKKKHMTAHPWHDLPYADNAPEEVNGFIEVPMNSQLKYELDKDSGFMKLDRVLYSAVHYPGDYGFIPQTLSEDGDPADILVISNFAVAPSTIVTARVIGILEMVDENERDEKIIAVHAKDPRFDKYTDISELGEPRIKEIQHFFETYKQLQGKSVAIKSIKGRVEAQEAVREAIENYKRNFEE